MAEFPKTKYHLRGGGSITVTTKEQEKALGPDWVTYPSILPELNHTSEAYESPKRRGRPPRIETVSN